MIQLYIFITAVVALLIIVARRKHIHAKEEKTRFKKKIEARVQELKRTAHEDVLKRFKEAHKKEQKKKKYDIAEYNLLIRRAEMAISKKQWLPAKRMLIKAIAMSKSDIFAGMKLASIYQQCGELAKAENLYRRLLEIRPNHPDIYANLGSIFVERKRYKEAINAYARAIDLDEKNDQNLVALGQLYAIMKHYDSAIECFRRATLLKPREVQYLFLLARTNEDNGDDQNALFACEKILTLEPYNEKAKEMAQDLRIKMHSAASGV